MQMPTYCLGEACVGKNKHAHYGKVDSTERTLCGRCAKTHGGVYLGKEKMCEDCKDKHASYGEEGGTKQWCGTCAKTHGGVYLRKEKMCEDCKYKHANYGEEGGKRQWCASCAKRHRGVWLGKGQMCE